ncbi:MAG TPA: vitamin K epoxide reductase family protein [Acidimicrobiales bacterium]|nr:vitamin K epoxide reductase family protein [Acidimicrobiales bacterium]
MEATESVARPDVTAAEPVGEDSAVPALIVVGSLILCLAGLAVSLYLTYEHYTGNSTLACSDTGVINCAKVTTSSSSRIFGIPVAVLGLAFFVPMLGLCLPAAWHSAKRSVHLVRTLLSASGVAMIIYLLYAELFRVHAICLWCTSVHVMTFLLFVLVWWAWSTGVGRGWEEIEAEAV